MDKLLPQTGVVTVTGPSGSGKTRRVLGANAGVEVPRLHVIASIAKGALPFPLPAITGAPSPLQRFAVARTDSPIDRRETVASFLSFDRLVTAMFAENRTRVCSHCKRRYERLTEADEIAAQFSEGMDVIIRILFSADEKREIIEESGFRVVDADELSSTYSAAIDEMTVELRTRPRLVASIATALSFTFGTVACGPSNGSSASYFHENGACPSCGAREPNLTRRDFDLKAHAEADDAIVPAEHLAGFFRLSPADRAFALGWVVSKGLTFTEFLNGELGSDFVKPLLGDLRSVTTLALDQVPLLRRVSSLSTGEQVQLRVLQLLLSAHADTVAIIDGISLALDPDRVSKLSDCVKKRAGTSPVVIIDNGNTELRTSTQPRVVTIEDLPGLNPAVVGVCGASRIGKTRFIAKKLLPALAHSTGKEVLSLDLETAQASQSHALVAEVLQAHSGILQLFALSEGAKVRGLSVKAFDRRSREGRAYFCPDCRGLGELETILQFSQGDYSSWSQCPTCSGDRILQGLNDCFFRGLSFLQIMQTTVSGACELFSRVLKIHAPLLDAAMLGLGHIPLGRPFGACSEGERRRLLILAAIHQAKNVGALNIGHCYWRLDKEQWSGLTKLLTRTAEAGTYVVVEAPFELQGIDNVIQLSVPS